ncbi:MAG: 3-deoxy-D-manno-octulosonic acid transferase [Planctomycetota bacterium]
MRFVIDCLYLLAIVLISPKIIYRMVRRGRYRTGWDQRLGKIRRRQPRKKCIWIHAVSVGEINATKSLVARLTESLGDYEIVISSTTDTGLGRAKTLYADDLEVFYFPFDLSCVMGRAFKNIQPDICLLMELEVWPNLARIANSKNIPVVVVNGRLSDESFPKYKLIKPITKWMFARVDLVLAQTEEYAARFRALGCSAEKVVVTSSLKYDTARIADKVAGADELAQQLNIGNERLWVAGGTGPGEEKICLEVFNKLRAQDGFADLRLAIVPRKPERFDDVAALITQAGFEFVRYSSIKTEQTKLTDKPLVILGDTMGDLTKFYSLATVVFVGRSLVPMGGSDMMESAALGKCTIFGPHTFNFKHTVDVLLKGEGAIEVGNSDGLFKALEKCLTDTAYARRIAANGRDVIKQNQGATVRTVKAVSELL